MADPGRHASIEPIGDAALVITVGSDVDPVLAARAQAIAARVQAARTAHPGIGRSVPAHASVLVPFDPLAIDLDTAIAVARRAVDEAAGADPGYASGPVAGEGDAAGERRLIEITVRYGGSDGPDLDDVAERLGLRAADVVELHAGSTYEVLFLGFAPGFGYLGGLPDALALPRRVTPRERVPPGSVAIAGAQTAVYPLAMPGGWHLIGRTDLVLFDAERDPPALFRPGATVRFVPVTGR